MEIKIITENTFTILSTIVGGLTGSWPGAIIGGVVGVVIDNMFQAKR